MLGLFTQAGPLGATDYVGAYQLHPSTHSALEAEYNLLIAN